MAKDRPQYYENDLQTVELNGHALTDTFKRLAQAASRGLEQIDQHYTPPEQVESISTFGTIFTGQLGVACLHIYRITQASTSKVAGEPIRPVLETPITELFKSAQARCPQDAPISIKLEHGRASPLCNPELGTAFIQLALYLIGKKNNIEGHNDDDGTPLDVIITRVQLIHEAIDYALEQPTAVSFRGNDMGIDEVLYGRAGLLLAILLLQDRVDEAIFGTHHATSETWALLFAKIPSLVNAIISAGTQPNPSTPSTEHLPPLSWPWLRTFHGLGFMHGTTGILTTLLLSPSTTTSPHYPLIASTITHLCTLCTSSSDHLPMSTPPFPSSSTRSSPLVQLCHGTPGLLLLLAFARRNTVFRDQHWDPAWDAAFRTGSERVWREGLLGKGGGICHGIAGNAVAWLVWCGCSTGKELRSSGEEGDGRYLRWALAFLEECMRTPPFVEEGEGRYRVPDHPYSLFEGLAGTVVVWLEALKLIREKFDVRL